MLHIPKEELHTSHADKDGKDQNLLAAFPPRKIGEEKDQEYKKDTGQAAQQRIDRSRIHLPELVGQTQDFDVEENLQGLCPIDGKLP
jgi:hypothetical protein